MGMFDTITIEPIGEFEKGFEGAWQTKDLHQFMYEFVIKDKKFYYAKQDGTLDFLPLTRDFHAYRIKEIEKTPEGSDRYDLEYISLYVFNGVLVDIMYLNGTPESKKPLPVLDSMIKDDQNRWTGSMYVSELEANNSDIDGHFCGRSDCMGCCS